MRKNIQEARRELPEPLEKDEKDDCTQKDESNAQRGGHISQMKFCFETIYIIDKGHGTTSLPSKIRKRPYVYLNFI